MKSTFQILLFIVALLLVASCERNRETQTQLKGKITRLFAKADAAPTKDLREKITDSAYFYLEQSNDRIGRELLFDVAVRYEALHLEQKYLKSCRLAYEKSKQQRDTLNLARASWWIGDYHQRQMQLDSAFKYFLQSEKMYRFLKDSVNYGRSILCRSRVLYDSGNFQEGIVQGIRGLQVLKNTNEKQLIYSGYVNVALSLKEVKDYQTAIEYLELSFTELLELEKTRDFPKETLQIYRATHYNNTGTIYERLGQYDKAIGYYNQGLQIEKLNQKWPPLYAALLSNLAYAKMKSGKTGDVELLLLRSLQIRDSLEILPGIISSKIKIGEYELIRRDTFKALQNFREGYDLSRIIKASAEMLQTLKLLTENDVKNKAYYSSQYFKVNDSVQAVERATQNKFARIAYETNQIEEQNQLLSRRNKIIIIASLFVLLTTLAGFVILRLRSKNKELLYIKEQQEANEKIYQLMLQQQSQTQAARNEERNRIAMELHDGIVNNIFTTRFNLMQLETQTPEKKDMLVRELEKTEQEVRKVSHDLQKSLSFEDKNLPEILASLVAGQHNDFGTEFDLSVDKYIDWATVSGADKIHIYRIVQEAIQNVNKYAKAKRCLIMLLKTDGKITVRIWDNGIGFQPDKTKQGIGLRNIRTRAAELGGTLRIASDGKSGTTIEVVF